MEKVFRLISMGFIKWPFLAVYSLTSAFHIWYVCFTETKPSAVISIFTALLDWLAILGFAKPKAFLHFRFWRWWFVWSLFWFFVAGYGRDILSGFSLDAVYLLIFSVATAYYFVFFSMVYAYAYVEKDIWRY